MDHTVTAWIALFPSKACTGWKSKPNTDVTHVKESLLQSTIPSTPKVPCCPIGRAVFLLPSIACVLVEGLPLEVILLLLLPKLLLLERGWHIR